MVGHLGCQRSLASNAYANRLLPRLPTVGAPRLELGTSALSGLRSNQLSYAPAYHPEKGGKSVILGRQPMLSKGPVAPV